MQKNIQQQSGVVIVMVLGMVTLMLTLLAFMIEKQQLMVRRVANQNALEQSYQYAQGVNAWAERVLLADQNRQSDFLNEDWAKFGQEPEIIDEDAPDEAAALNADATQQTDEEPAPRIDFGVDGLEMQIEDLQGRFNLNNLANTNPQLRGGQARIFLNILQIIGVDTQEQRSQLYAALFDWLDSNDLQTTSGGVESNDYTSRDTPYYAADQNLKSLGELRYVDGFDTELIAQLRPYVTVLPVNNARINLNTTSGEVLAALNSGIVVDTAATQGFLATREAPGFAGFTQANLMVAFEVIAQSSAVPQPPIANMLQTNSQFFAINTKVSLGDYVYCMRSTVSRRASGIAVLSRERDTACLQYQQN